MRSVLTYSERKALEITEVKFEEGIPFREILTSIVPAHGKGWDKNRDEQKWFLVAILSLEAELRQKQEWVDKPLLSKGLSSIFPIVFIIIFFVTLFFGGGGSDNGEPHHKVMHGRY